MSPYRLRLAGKLSGGMKQKLGLVCALIHTPQVILLDEPTNGVDPVSRRDFWAILYSLLGENVAILIATSYLDEAERCHRVALLHEGRLLYCDTPEELKKKVSGAVVAVTSSEPRKLRDLLTDAEGVSNVVLMGDGCTSWWTTPRSASPNCGPGSLRRICPSTVSKRSLRQ